MSFSDTVVQGEAIESDNNSDVEVDAHVNTTQQKVSRVNSSIDQQRLCKFFIEMFEISSIRMEKRRRCIRERRLNLMTKYWPTPV